MKYILLTLSFFFFNQLSAQVSGTITDKDKEALPGASVALFQGGELVAGTTTDDRGYFSLPAGPGDYVLEVSFISFEKLSRKISISPAGEAVDFGTIVIKEASSKLDEVTVEAQASMMEFQQDKRVFNVAKDLSSAGSNGSEILNNIPSVAVDIEGNVSLRGSENVRILVNGKPSGLIGNDPATALRQLQGNMIEKIEVITNPSARYDAEGEAGIINIVLKKNDKAGINGNFEVSAGYPDNYGIAAGINYRTGRFNWFANLSGNYRNSPGGGYSEQENFLPDTSYTFIRDRDQTRGGLNAALRFGADYNLTETQSLTATFLYRPSMDKNFARISYQDYDQEGTLRKRQIREDDEKEDEITYEGDLHWEKRYEGKDHKWTADINFQDEEDEENSVILQRTYFDSISKLPTASPSETTTQYVRNIENQQNILFQSDYVRPFTDKRSFETGARVTMRDIVNDYKVEEEDEDGNLQQLDKFTDRFQYQENIFAAYAIYNDAIGEKITYQAGLRAEYTDLTTEVNSQGDPNNRRYANLFPSAFFTYDINELGDFQLSYSRRISRPRFRHLLPFYSFSDPRVFYSGNPDLNPEFTDSYEFGYVRYWPSGSLYSGIYHRHRSGVVERIYQVDDLGNTTIFPINLSVADAYGFEFTLQQKVASWLNLSGNLNLYYSSTVGEYEGQDLSATTFASQGRMSSRFSFWNSDLQLSFNYRGPRNDSQGRTLGIYTADLGWSKDLLKNKATFTISVQDLFNGRKRRGYTDGPNFSTYSEFQWRQRQITATFVYRLNQKKKRGPAGGGREDMGGDEF